MSHASIIPLIGGETIAMQNVFGEDRGIKVVTIGPSFVCTQIYFKKKVL